MPIICPSILASTPEEYKAEMAKVTPFAHRLQIDLTDGQFAETKTVTPEQTWWPAGVKADFHFMFKNPRTGIEAIINHAPNLVIAHAEAEADFEDLAQYCHAQNVKFGVALLPETSPDKIKDWLEYLDHVLIFSGDLGHYGGHVDLSLLSKARFLKAKKTTLEIGWDGGVNDQNISQLAFGGIDVFISGGFIQNAKDPEKAYKSLERIAEETGTT